MEKIKNFSDLIMKYKIKCYDEMFDKLILKKFNENDVKIAKEINSDTLLIGIPYKINIIEKLNILILGNEIKNTKILGYFLRNKERINFFTLSQLSSQYYLNKFNIKSTVIKFDSLLCNNNDKKIIYFNQKNDYNYKLIFLPCSNTMHVFLLCSLSIFYLTQNISYPIF